jgi:hypothetical protein
VFEEGNDDRMWRFVPQILPASLHYLKSGGGENKLLMFNVWILMQSTQWAIGVDPQVLSACFSPEVITQILEITLGPSFLEVAQFQARGAGGLSVEGLQQKRYAAKILTLMFRDFLNASSQLKTKFSKAHCKQVYFQSLKCLQYFLPFYLQAITFNPHSEEGEEDFEIEFQSLIVQVLSLMSTLISVHPKIVLKELRPLAAPTLLVMLMYSLKSPPVGENY